MAVLIACKVLEKELLHALPDDADVEIVWLEAGLHASLPRLEEALTDGDSRGKAFGTKGVSSLRAGLPSGDRILSGQPGGGGVSGEELHRSPSRQRCAGDQRHEDDDHDALDGCARGRPSWKPWDGTRSMSASTWGGMNAYLSSTPGLEPLTDEETLLFFDLVQVPVEIKKIDLSVFRDLLAKLLEQDHPRNGSCCAGLLGVKDEIVLDLDATDHALGSGARGKIRSKGFPGPICLFVFRG